MIPPMIMRIGIGNVKYGLPLPLFLLWPFVIALFVPLFFVLLLAWLTGRLIEKRLPSPVTLLLFWQLICAAKGLLIQVKDKEDSFVFELK